MKIAGILVGTICCLYTWYILATFVPGRRAQDGEMQGVDSWVFVDVMYEGEKHALTLVFDHGGMYTFHNVPRTVYREFLSVKSKGTFFNRRIKGKYPSETTRGTEPSGVEDTQDLSDGQQGSDPPGRPDKGVETSPSAIGVPTPAANRNSQEKLESVRRHTLRGRFWGGRWRKRSCLPPPSRRFPPCGPGPWLARAPLGLREPGGEQ